MEELLFIDNLSLRTNKMSDNTLRVPGKISLATIYPAPSDSTVSINGISLPVSSDRDTPKGSSKRKSRLLSIMVGSKDTTDKPRKDLYGSKIDKKLKIHHVSFKDEAGGKLAEIKEVESYKEHNKIEPTKCESGCCVIL